MQVFLQGVSWVQLLLTNLTAKTWAQASIIVGSTVASSLSDLLPSHSDVPFSQTVPSTESSSKTQGRLSHFSLETIQWLPIKNVKLLALA